MLYKERLHKLQQVIQKENCDAFLVEDAINLFYLTGLELSAGYLIVHAKGAELFVDNRYFERCQKECPFPVNLLDTPPLAEWLTVHKIDIFGFDSSTTPYKRYQELIASWDKHRITLSPLDNPVKRLRMLKDPEELVLLRQAADLGSKGFDHALNILKEGITEEEVAAEIEIFWKRHGSKSIAFDLIIAFGANSSMPHYHAGKTELRRGDIVLIDIGVNYRHYHSDMTRVVFYGDPDPKLMEIYEVVRSAQLAALNICKAGMPIGVVDLAARELIDHRGYGPNFTHGLGHGVGLEIHELPVVRNKGQEQKQPLESGMVITIEPGVYLPGLGGVRIEDSIIIHEFGYENLTKRSTDPLII